MDLEKSLSIQANSSPIKVSEYFNGGIRERRWELAYDFKTKMYLTDEERLYFLQQIGHGASVVQIKDLTLTTKFLYMIPIREKNPTRYKIVKKEDGSEVAVEISEEEYAPR